MPIAAGLAAVLASAPAPAAMTPVKATAETRHYRLELDIGAGVGSQGTLTMLGGQMTLTNGTGQIAIGLGGLGRLALSGGSILARGLCVGCSNGPDAQLTMLAGSLTVLSNMVVGDCGLSAFAVVEIEMIDNIETASLVHGGGGAEDGSAGQQAGNFRNKLDFGDIVLVIHGCSPGY